MSRLLLALVVVLGLAFLAVPASAHVHGSRGVGAAVPVSTAEPFTARHGAATAEIVATAVPTVPLAARCDRDCGHGDGMGGCNCMAACIPLAASDLPNLPVPGSAAGLRSGDAAPWRPTAHGPPTPPPRS